MAPLVSIITPAHNAAATIGEAVASVLGQTTADWELLIVDDGSTDETAAAARQAAGADGRVRILQPPPRRHAGATRNAGIAGARGEFIAFLDADDVWLPGKLERQLGAIRAVDRPGICFTAVSEFWDQSGRAPSLWPKSAPSPTREAQYRENLLIRHWPCTSAILVPANLVREIGGFTESPELKVGEDWDFVLKCLWRRPLVFVPESLVRYRVSASSLTWASKRGPETRFANYRLVEERGEMPPELRSKAYSTAWVVKAEVLLERREPGWREAFLRALAMDPGNPRRWPAAMAAVLPAAGMAGMWRGLKGL